MAKDIGEPIRDEDEDVMDKMNEDDESDDIDPVKMRESGIHIEGEDGEEIDGDLHDSALDPETLLTEEPPEEDEHEMLDEDEEEDDEEEEDEFDDDNFGGGQSDF